MRKIMKYWNCGWSKFLSVTGVSLTLLSLFYLLSAHALTTERYPFLIEAQRVEFQGLLNELRCLVCQNQNLADSNAELAKDLREQIYALVLANHSEAQIKQYMTQRYGDFILFKPPLKGSTLGLWLTPCLLLVGGGCLLWRITRPRRASL